MPVVRGCNLPDELLYDVDNHIWFQDQGDGTVKIGMTAVATAMAGKLVAYTPKRVGRSVRAGKSCGTLESGKWVGPAKSAAGGEVVAVNDDLVNNPSLANDDPYAAWLAVNRKTGTALWARWLLDQMSLQPTKPKWTQKDLAAARSRGWRNTHE